jgi:hypothetical protein
MKKGQKKSALSAQFDVFFEHLQEKEINGFIPTMKDYVVLKKSAGYPFQSDMYGLVDSTTMEYSSGWEGIKAVLKALWNKFLGDNFASQELANSIFTLLLRGVEKGWQAVKNALNIHISEGVWNDIESVINALNELFFMGKKTQLVEDIYRIRNQFDAPIDGKKLNFWQKILRGASVALQWIVGKN